MHSVIITGNAAKVATSSTNGWVVGHFMKGLAHSKDLEIKFWHYTGQPNYPQKIFGGTEFIIVEAGILKLEVETPDGRGGFEPLRQVELNGSTGDYVILPPGCRKRVLVISAPTHGITVRWPSSVGRNTVVT